MFWEGFFLVYWTFQQWEQPAQQPIFHIWLKCFTRAIYSEAIRTWPSVKMGPLALISPKRDTRIIWLHDTLTLHWEVTQEIDKCTTKQIQQKQEATQLPLLELRVTASNQQEDQQQLDTWPGVTRLLFAVCELDLKLHSWPQDTGYSCIQALMDLLLLRLHGWIQRC